MNRLDKLVIVGASGHGKVIADIAKAEWIQRYCVSG